MKKLVPFLFSFLLSYSSLYSQQTKATDFNMSDCNGVMHHLFSELDSGNCVIIEYFMLSCASCVVAGQHMEPMYQSLKAKYGNKVRWYHFGYTNNYTCSSIVNWVTTNGFTSTPFDSGAFQVAYYGGMGMPTVVVVAGKGHDVLFSNVGFVPNDTAVMAAVVDSFFGGSSVNEHLIEISLQLFPNPVSKKLNVNSNNFLNIKNAAFYITDVTGKLIDVVKIPDGSNLNTVIEVDQFQNGIYFIELKSDIYFFKNKFIVNQ